MLRSMFRVTFSALVFAFGMAAVLSATALAAEFPYVAYVAEADSYVRSGPGREHYPTGQAPLGTAVEVYRHDAGGWCAIRPPQGSFSLVPTHQLRVAEAGAAQVTADGVVARVGSTLGEQRSAVQVMLARGEAVALAEQPSPTSPWVRIAPPAGEFRWIAARRLSRTPPTETTGATAAARGWQSFAQRSAGTAANPTDETPLTGGDPFAHLSAAAGAGVPTSAPTVAVNPAWAPGAAPDQLPAEMPGALSGDGIQIIAGSPAEVRQAQFQQAAGAANGSTAPPVASGAAMANQTNAASAAAPAMESAGQPRIRFEGLSAGAALDARAAELQLRLSKIVVGAPASWQLAGLREETATLLALEQSPELRDQFRNLLDRIATFESIQTRYRTLAPAAPILAAVNGGAAPGAVMSRLPAQADAEVSEVLARVRSDLGGARPETNVGDNGITPTPSGPAPSATEALYDAVGTLKPVVSRRAGAPQFALIDDHGDVVSFVTAPPDVNLQAFLGQRIGVRGSRGFMPEYRRAHVTASRVTTLEQTRLK